MRRRSRRVRMHWLAFPASPWPALLGTLTALALLAATAQVAVRAQAPSPPATGPAGAPPCPAQDDLSEQDGPRASDVDGPARFIREPGESDESTEIRSSSTWWWHHLTYPTGRLPYQAFSKALGWVRENVCEAPPWGHDEEAGRLTPEGAMVIGSGTWTFLGPRPIDMSTYDPSSWFVDGHVTGRFDAVAVDPRTVGSPDGSITAFAGGATGGLWKTTNCCGPDTVWLPLWDAYVAPTQACGAIEFDPNDPDVVYAGTGTFDFYEQHSEGLMKSGDGGATWTQLGADVFVPNAPGTPLYQNQAIGAIRVDPNNSDTVVVGTRFDLFISHDAGQSWTRCVFGANPTDPTHVGNPTKTIHRVSGILLDPTTRPTTLYVAVGYESNPAYNGDNGVYKGVLPDSGTPTLTLVSTPSNGWPAGTGTGAGNATDVGRIRLASSRGNAQGNLVVYAQVSSVAHGNALGTWVTTDQGATWKQLAGSADSSFRSCNGIQNGEAQDWYDLFILADPLNDKLLTIGRTSLYRATVDASYSSMALSDIGSVYSGGPRTQSCPGYGRLHPDQHGATWIGTSGRFLLGNDGGLYAGDGTAGGFTQLNDTVNATQWYAGQISANFAGGGPQYLLAGAQDNGSASWDGSHPDLTWQGRTGADGFFTAFDPLQASLASGRAYTEVYNGQLFCSGGGIGSPTWSYCAGPWFPGDSPGFLTPFKLDAFHCATGHCDDMVLGATHLWASASSTAPSWVQAGRPVLTKGLDIGSLDVAPSSPTSVVVGSEDGNVQWSNNVFTGSGCTQSAANTGSFACSPNSNATWVDLTAGNAILPNRAISGVAFDPTTDQKLYAAVSGFNENTPSTPGHLLMAACSGSCSSAASWSWTDKSGNLPDVPAESVAVNPNVPSQVFVGTDLGFYFTDDITQNPPVWMRYSYGLPNTVIKYLALDRGPDASPYASTALVAFTYGRGTYAIRLPGAGGFQPFAASASASPTVGTEPLPVSFGGSASGGTAPYTYAWNFGDGSTSSDQNPQHTFASAGTYTIRLVVIDNAVRVAAETQLSIHVAHALTVSTTATAAGGVKPLAVSFHSSVSGGAPPYAYAWSFGDGGSSSDANPAHTYTSTGSQNVSLGVTDAQGHSGHDDHLQVTVTPPPPVISGVKKGNPFKLVVTGSNFQQTFFAFINGAYWQSASWKSATKIQIAGGSTLKQAVPKGTPVTITILNGDGGAATTTFSW